MKKFTSLLVSALAAGGFAQINDLVKTPPMGWNSWNVFHENINEKQIKEIADIMVSSGMRDAGYIYLNLDDNWMHTKRDAQGNLQAHPTAFPSGMKALADYIHSKGLKFGVYGDRGKRTCHHYNARWDSENGSYMHEEQDAKKFAEWGVDYLKYDNCDPAPNSNQQQDYERMRDALLKSGRDIVYSICAWEYKDWMPKTGNLWRTTGDISNAWETASNSWFKGVINIADLNEKYYKLAGPGHWNDPDMLEVGNGVLSINESKSQMALWSIMAAPMLTGSDLRKMSTEIKDLYLNAEMIAVNQDSAGIAGHRLSSNDGKEIWMRPLGGENTGVMAVALLNRGKSSATIELKFEDLGLKGDVSVRDIWQKKDLGIQNGSLSAEVPSHGVAFLRISAKIEPQAPFGEKAIALPGIVQAEDYDKGSSGLAYSDDDFENKGGKYREDGVDIVECKNAEAAASENCYAIGYTNAGEWMEYTVNVASAGEYNVTARVASGSDDSGFRLFMDDKAITDSIVVPNGGDWDTYSIIKVGSVKLDAGEQILKLAITGTFVNIDYLEFKSATAVSNESDSTEKNNSDDSNLDNSNAEISNADKSDSNKSDVKNPAPADSNLAIFNQPVMNLDNYITNKVLVFNMNGALLGEISLQQVGDAAGVRSALKQAGFRKGVYIVRSKNNLGSVKSMKVGLYE